MNKTARDRQGCKVQDGQLYIENIPVCELVKNFPTPVYVYSQSFLEKQMETFVNAFKSPLFSTRVIFASKAFNVKAVLQLAHKKGMGLDVVSAGELFTARASGFPMEKVVFHGNNKSQKELEMALEWNVGTVVLDNLSEARLLARLAPSFPESRITALIRVNPGVEAHTHQFIVTAHVDSKFGILSQDLETLEACAACFDGIRQVSFEGFHAHIGSQIFDEKAFQAEIQAMGRCIAAFEEKTGRPVYTLDLGGGFAAWYTDQDCPIEIPRVCQVILEECSLLKEHQAPHLENVWIEPGRSIAANAGCTLYTIGTIKQTPHKTYYFADGGMNDNIRPALYDAAYTCDIANRMDEEKSCKVTVAGKCCESGDILVKEAWLPKACPGDILAVYTTGAYGYSMASHYNKLPVPGVVFVKDDKAYWAVRPESLEDLIAREEDLFE